MLYRPNPAHKTSTTEAGVGAWRPGKEPCPKMTVAERDALLKDSISEDASVESSRRFAIRRAQNRLEFFEAKFTRMVDSEPEFHGHLTIRVPASVLRKFLEAGTISRPEYEELRRGLG